MAGPEKRRRVGRRGSRASLTNVCEIPYNSGVKRLLCLLVLLCAGFLSGWQQQAVHPKMAQGQFEWLAKLGDAKTDGERESLLGAHPEWLSKEALASALAALVTSKADEAKGWL